MYPKTLFIMRQYKNNYKVVTRMFSVKSLRFKEIKIPYDLLFRKEKGSNQRLLKLYFTNCTQYLHWNQGKDEGRL